MKKLLKVLKIIGFIILSGIILFVVYLLLNIPDTKDIVESYKAVGLVSDE